MRRFIDPFPAAVVGVKKRQVPEEVQQRFIDGDWSNHRRSQGGMHAGDKERTRAGESIEGDVLCEKWRRKKIID